jgi:phospholipid-binding lipoprotein MlaA
MRRIARQGPEAAVRRIASGILALGVLTAASTAQAAPEPAAEPPATPVAGGAAPYDPWEGVNRRTYGFNAGLDRYLFAPITHAYVHVAPAPVRRSVGSALDNLREPRNAINGLAQGRPGLAGRATSRFVVNSTIGVLGLFDVATPMGLKAGEADFGQTLGRYGAQPGPYLVLPVLGPHNLRDALGRLADSLTDPFDLVVGGPTTTAGATRLGASALDYRAAAEPALSALDDATDPYATLRSAYMQHRAYDVGEARGEAETLPDFDAPNDAP